VLNFVHVDHLNTPRLVADAAGTTVWKWDQQEAFGNNVPDENPSGLGTFDLPLRLPGQYVDKETNLHYNYYRDYDPSLGRYGQSDPIGLRGGLNTFWYAAGNPLSFNDPSGLQASNSCQAKPKPRPDLPDLPCDRSDKEKECWCDLLDDQKKCLSGLRRFVVPFCMEYAREKHRKCLEDAYFPEKK
jgi:RHS repeat-associated protein